MRILALLPFKIEEQFWQKTYPLDMLRSNGAVQMNQEVFPYVCPPRKRISRIKWFYCCI